MHTEVVVVGAGQAGLSAAYALHRAGTDFVVLDADGAVVVERERVEEVLVAARERADRERVKRAKLEAGELSYDLDGLRRLVEG